MKTRIALTLFALAVAVPAHAQQSDAWDAYNAQKKHEWLAVGLEVILPTAGHAYSGDWRRGVTPAILQIGGLAVVSAVYSDCGSVNTCTSNQDITMGTAAIVAVGGAVWSYVSAYYTAAGRNRDLRDRLGITPTLSMRPVQKDRVEVAASFPFRLR